MSHHVSYVLVYLCRTRALCVTKILFQKKLRIWCPKKYAFLYAYIASARGSIQVGKMHCLIYFQAVQIHCTKDIWKKILQSNGLSFDNVLSFEANEKTANFRDPSTNKYKTKEGKFLYTAHAVINLLNCKQFMLQGSHNLFKTFESSYPSAKRITKVSILTVSGTCPSAIRKIF